MILSLEVFNRLHYIHQTSMAFMVYPGLKHSRFTHSLGVMHLSSGIFINSLSNSPHLAEFLEDSFNEFKKKLHKKIPEFIREKEKKGILSGDFYIKFISKGFIGKDIKDILDSIKKFYENNHDDMNILSKLPHTLITQSTPRYLSSEHLEVFLALLHQSVRIAALLHDLGHLPFSHDLERVLIDTYHKYLDEANKGEVRKWYVDSLKYYIETERPKKIHEIITCKLIDIIFSSLLQSNSYGDSLKRPASYLLTYLWYLVQIILGCEGYHEKFRKLSGLNTIISETIDADRMDFVLRDGKMSGVLESTADITRLINFYVLVKSPEGRYNYVFVPSVRTLNDYKTLLFDRFRMYKYVFSHHKVILYDSILERIIRELIDYELNYYENNPDEFEIFKVETLNIGDIVLGIVLTLSNLKEGNLQLGSLLFIQLDDNWLLSMLRRKHLELRIKKLFMSERLSDFEEELFPLLDQLFTGGKSYKSLWKRSGDYIKFFERFLDGEGEAHLISLMNLVRAAELLGEFKGLSEKLLGEWVMDSSDRERFNKVVKFLNILLFLWEYNYRFHREMLNNIENYLREKLKYEGVHFMVISSLDRLKIGIKQAFMARFYRDKTGQVKLDLVPAEEYIPNLIDYLRKEKLLSPHFNVYYCLDGGDASKLRELKEKVERNLGETLALEVRRISFEFFMDSLMKGPPVYVVLLESSDVSLDVIRDQVISVIESSRDREDISRLVTLIEVKPNERLVGYMMITPSSSSYNFHDIKVQSDSIIDITSRIIQKIRGIDEAKTHKNLKIYRIEHNIDGIFEDLFDLALSYVEAIH